MSKTVLVDNPTGRKAYIITGPTSGIGRRTALELAKHGTVVLVGRDRRKLDELQQTIEQKGQHAVPRSLRSRSSPRCTPCCSQSSCVGPNAAIHANQSTG